MNKVFDRLIIMLVLSAMFSAFATPVFADAPTQDKQPTKYEVKFMENMIDHPAMSVLMAEMCTRNLFIPN